MRQVLSENEALFLLRMRLDVEQKKLCVLYGNCQILSLAQYFLHCKDFCRNFLLFVIPTVNGFPSIKSQDLLYENFWELASFFVSQVIQESNKCGYRLSSKKIESQISDDCMIKHIPNVFLTVIGHSKLKITIILTPKSPRAAAFPLETNM